ncbi:hypothetical protein CCACVL1_03041 [Corchorus capsularis]|uniref:Uncharacterized protein n=1 Tax=Corchorus capsularis TaxID=210143 RepID=A0A1R3K3K6_COCAP|nr:hypothetical protein CCACVL1_03041 [Corchorus capsularis]
MAAQMTRPLGVCIRSKMMQGNAKDLMAIAGGALKTNITTLDFKLAFEGTASAFTEMELALLPANASVVTLFPDHNLEISGDFNDPPPGNRRRPSSCLSLYTLFALVLSILAVSAITYNVFHGFYG